jgi:nicotinamidase-related amidase
MSLLRAETTLLLCVDWQERLLPAMPEGHRQRALGQALLLRWLADELGIPVLFTEQYPKGLGPTLPAFKATDAVEKLSFSALGEPALGERLAALPLRREVLLTGMETHICVAQTASDLRAQGYTVRMVADAALSRRKLDWRLGLEQMAAEGCAITTAEAVAFALVQRAGGPIFKELSRRIR